MNNKLCKYCFKVLEEEAEDDRYIYTCIDDNCLFWENGKGSKGMKKPNYEEAYHILAEYFDSIADEEKEEVDRRLKECGL
jgi:hypothetical protein